MAVPTKWRGYTVERWAYNGYMLKKDAFDGISITARRSGILIDLIGATNGFSLDEISLHIKKARAAKAFVERFLVEHDDLQEGD